MVLENIIDTTILTDDKIPTEAEFFEGKNEMVIKAEFPFRQSVLNFIILSSMILDERVLISIKGIKNKEDAKLALFTANQMELSILFEPTDNKAEFSGILQSLANVWIKDKSIKINVMPFSIWLSEYINSVLKPKEKEPILQLALLYSNELYCDEQYKKEIIGIFKNTFPKKRLVEFKKSP